MKKVMTFVVNGGEYIHLNETPLCLIRSFKYTVSKMSHLGKYV